MRREVNFLVVGEKLLFMKTGAVLKKFKVAFAKFFTNLACILEIDIFAGFKVFTVFFQNSDPIKPFLDDKFKTLSVSFFKFHQRLVIKIVEDIHSQYWEPSHYDVHDGMKMPNISTCVLLCFVLILFVTEGIPSRHR